MQSWLKPGGRVLISDYCCGNGEWNEEFKAYVAQRRYDLHTVAKYGQVSVISVVSVPLFSIRTQILEQAGFSGVKAVDRTDLFVEMLKAELVRINAGRKEFVKVSLMRHHHRSQREMILILFDRSLALTTSSIL